MAAFEALPWSTDATVIIVGFLELITAGALILGFFTHWFAALAAIQLAVILILLKFQQVRDIGLLGAAVYLPLAGSDWGWVGQLMRRKANGE